MNTQTRRIVDSERLIELASRAAHIARTATHDLDQAVFVVMAEQGDLEWDLYETQIKRAASLLYEKPRSTAHKKYTKHLTSASASHAARERIEEEAPVLVLKHTEP